MIVCSCNAISDKRHVEPALRQPLEKVTTGSIYKEAAKIAGCENCKMQCAQCNEWFKNIAQERRKELSASAQISTLPAAEMA
jgi:bacterioferritin-associated ferredoxin